MNGNEKEQRKKDSSEEAAQLSPDAVQRIEEALKHDATVEMLASGDLSVLPQLAWSRPARQVDMAPVDLDAIIERVARMIATTQDHYKCIMFTDLESSTEFKRKMGHTKGYMRNRLFCDICEEAVVRYHGQVVKRLGDGVMVVFEHAIDAVLAALLIKRSIHAGRKKLKKLIGPLSHRIGITCGYVKEIPGEAEDFIGHAMDKGARIQTMARRNQILIDEIVYGLIHTKIRDYSGDILIGKPRNVFLKGVGQSTLYEVAPKDLGLESSLGARLKSWLGLR
ncbi:MAG: adenylate/guanylate cyclase domain-containing protein [Mariprofundaceae bacterium]